MMLNDLKSRIQGYPRCPLAVLPTALHPLPRLGAALGCEQLYVKRDDLTGLAMGGNKTRKLEWIMADLLAQGCDTLLTWGGRQSNWCRQTAAAAAAMGIESHLMLLSEDSSPSELSANLILDNLLGAHLHEVKVPRDARLFHLRDLRHLVDPILTDLESRGRKVYLVGVGGSMVEGSMSGPLGALAYLHAFVELIEQTREQNLSFQRLVVTSGSASTQAGLLAGARLLCPEMDVIGITVTVGADWMSRWVLTLAEALLDDLNVPLKIDPKHVRVLDGYMGRGYGVLDPVTLDAVRLTASLEGLLLDPVYSGKGMAGLIGQARSGLCTTGSTLFWHTGGTPALFAYGPEVCRF